ncbi:Na+/H+ antiporter NhaA [[Actinomadura] parvosata]|uniref:Na+/H+ antiporter NhaA n=1 Tax=[Actinomadura] parvosata TaxID=1955412 RepID=UPI0009ACE890|nr:Na+/H+ antiporter NhaA [Nonomuraea sp. ATCC 55076]
MPAVLTRIIAALRSDPVSGLLLIGAALVALVWANSPVAGSYEALGGFAFAARIQAGLGRDAVITGLSYRLLAPAEAGSAQAAVRAVADGIGDPGNLRMLVVGGRQPTRPGGRRRRAAGAPAGSAGGRPGLRGGLPGARTLVAVTCDLLWLVSWLGHREIVRAVRGVELLDHHPVLGPQGAHRVVGPWASGPAGRAQASHGLGLVDGSCPRLADRECEHGTSSREFKISTRGLSLA